MQGSASDPQVHGDLHSGGGGQTGKHGLKGRLTCQFWTVDEMHSRPPYGAAPEQGGGHAALKHREATCAGAAHLDAASMWESVGEEELGRALRDLQWL